MTRSWWLLTVKHRTSPVLPPGRSPASVIGALTLIVIAVELLGVRLAMALIRSILGLDYPEIIPLSSAVELRAAGIEFAASEGNFGDQQHEQHLLGQ
ncbi:uncharacterized protein BO97DRAFT_408101 [Aspergillus homomorphus CBS 101889]|uniref:Uncharacterized protein n=1 Tax=Aspergillus homomorphus (strain CBS 101889) TaxID=1450537 RepID=A0A395HPS3_ASPHC|nr:hypothetical protein BO97DRAFT_408101 [Aspergillus homomorphus CBS 101889]RAL08858.1 hypothetical protein BO97DRAFT_408101 [Aspergillus homomorphus CBS 101889]